MYNVIFIDSQGSETNIAADLSDRQVASQIAREVAAARGAGRMVLPGSSKPPNCVCVVPVASPVQTAAA